MASGAPQSLDPKGRLSQDDRNEPRPYNLESRVPLQTTRLTGPAGHLILSNSNMPPASQLVLTNNNTTSSPPSQLILTNSNLPVTSQLRLPNINSPSTKTVGARSVPYNNKKKKPEPPKELLCVRIQNMSYLTDESLFLL